MLAVVDERGNAVLKGVDGMDKAKILRLCNEIEKEISEAWNCDVIEYDKAGHIISIAQKIAAEITAPPKTNSYRIRQMTDEELADWLTDGHDICEICAFDACLIESECEKGVLAWLKQEVSEDAG